MVKDINIVSRIQYSLVYMLYKSKYYRTGKGYIYRSNLSISIAGSFIVSFAIFQMAKNLSNGIKAGIFLFIWLIFFALLERNITRSKLFRYRKIYTDYKKNVLIFLCIILSIATIEFLLYKL
ncbi:MAG: hypothetical protein DI535_23130 [Citrobacter freundii]|nr:MAG: hypothetical protein DI535_23130 [Citrobacter freundii]